MSTFESYSTYEVKKDPVVQEKTNEKPIAIETKMAGLNLDNKNSDEILNKQKLSLDKRMKAEVEDKLDNTAFIKEVESGNIGIDDGNKSVDKTSEEIADVQAKIADVEAQIKLEKSGKKSGNTEGVARQGLKGFIDTMKNITDALSDTFAPLIALMKSLYAESGLGETKETPLEKAFLKAKSQLAFSTNKDYIDNGNGKQIRYLQGLDQILLGEENIKDNTKLSNFKKVFSQAPIENQKEYIIAALKDPDKKFDSPTKDILGKKIDKPTDLSETAKDVIETNNETTIENNSIEKPFTSGGNYPELSIDAIKPGKVEKKGQGDNEYLAIDGQVITLIEGKGSLFVKGGDDKIIEKIISFSKDAEGKENIVISNGNALENDQTTLASVFKDNKIQYPSDLNASDNKKFNLLKYYALEQGIDSKNPIDVLMGVKNKPIGFDENIALLKSNLAKDKVKTPASIQKILGDGKTKLLTHTLSDPDKKTYEDAVTIWITALNLRTAAT